MAILLGVLLAVGYVWLGMSVPAVAMLLWPVRYAGIVSQGLL
jgi:hypothetical protein